MTGILRWENGVPKTLVLWTGFLESLGLLLKPVFAFTRVSAGQNHLTSP